MTPREFFESAKLLTTNSRKAKEFEIFGWLVFVNWADSGNWSSLTDSGYLYDMWVSFSTVRTPYTVHKFYKLTFFKLSLAFTNVRKYEKVSNSSANN